MCKFLRLRDIATEQKSPRWLHQNIGKAVDQGLNFGGLRELHKAVTSDFLERTRDVDGEQVSLTSYTLGTFEEFF
jgi:hypothetical protein